MKSALIGHTGFVGSNLITQHKFSHLYNSKNIMEINGQRFDLVVCAGVSATKWLANQEPINDFLNIEKLKDCLKSMKTKTFILISTVDIYDTPKQAFEDTAPNSDKQDHYGKHRYQLEQWVRQQFPNNYILRLPALFGNNLKKNLIYDILNPMAKSINKNLWLEIKSKLPQQSILTIKQYYTENEFGNLQQYGILDKMAKNKLGDEFAKANFSTLHFTDSRSGFQFYNLANLWNDISMSIEKNRSILNLASEPIIASELVKAITGKEFISHLPKGPVNYDMYTKYSENHYFYSKVDIIEQIKSFIKSCH